MLGPLQHWNKQSMKFNYKTQYSLVKTENAIHA